ncbi:OPT oligopeptide transporter [Wolfiporia cocos MD-104 SS10]|uniref:OPT oligopeptide transporter n=1 Tax=Wolfiporia cocos (strain MD-104) TaxID=742152 RepID=A0A2H3J3P2_WOLCO|nr:OPT oligopeptide transporter [Wolfiporia cocos MD-104 SS10]
MDYDFDELTEEEEDSPYPEVRASVSNIDDTEMPALTIRMWFVGLILTFIAAAANMFFYMRQPAPDISTTLIVLVSHPIGKFLARVMPIRTFRVPRFLGGGEFSLNPGPWNIKEHALVYMMANVATGTPYAIQATISIDVSYGLKLGYWFNTVLILATQLTGFGLAGFCKRLLVWPASMVWPQNLIMCALLNTLHAEEDEPRGGISRFRYLCYVGTGAFFWYFLPGYLFTALSVFSWPCWIAPNNVPVNQLFGFESGLGMGFVTFDWTQISWITSPMMVPWWAQVQIFAGFVIFYWIITPALYYTNVWDMAYFPMISDDMFDRFGISYNVSRVLDSQGNFDNVAYDAYSPLYLPAAYVVVYLLAFALATCAIVHTALYHGPELWKGIKRTAIEQDDIHAKLMRAYPEVPSWWYLVSFVGFFCLAIVAVEVWHTEAPVWFLVLAVLIPIMYIIPSGYINSITGQIISINILAQIIPGVVLPGQPIPNMIFKSYALQTLSEGSRFVQDMKLGHYIKVPPRATFIVQLVSTLLVAFIQCGMQQWMFDKVPHICSPNQKYDLTCPHNQVFFEASVLWGVIGPTRQFGKGSMYYPELFAVIVGAVLPIPFWLWQRKYPDSWVRYLNTLLILNSISSIPPATGINYSSWFMVGCIFMFYLRRHRVEWWSKFNYVTSAALDSGTIISLLFIFFVLEFPKGGFFLNWWGNTVWQKTADYNHVPFKTPPLGGI